MFSLETWARQRALAEYQAFMAWVAEQEDGVWIEEDMGIVDAALGMDGPMTWPEAVEAVERLVSVAVRYERVGAWVDLFEGLTEQWSQQGGDGNG